MLVILRNGTKKRLKVACQIVIAVVLGVVVSMHFFNLHLGRNIIKEGWLQNDKPSGNPMKVENIRKQTVNKDPGVLNQFVVKMKDFYHNEK